MPTANRADDRGRGPAGRLHPARTRPPAGQGVRRIPVAPEAQPHQEQAAQAAARGPEARTARRAALTMRRACGPGGCVAGAGPCRLRERSDRGCRWARRAPSAAASWARRPPPIRCRAAASGSSIRGRRGLRGQQRRPRRQRPGGLDPPGARRRLVRQHHQARRLEREADVLRTYGRPFEITPRDLVRRRRLDLALQGA